jgi:hypothetical protein
LKVNKSQEINTISDRIKQAVWNGEIKDSKGYIVDLSNIKNTMEITATIEEPIHESFTTESHFYIEKDKVDIETAIDKYEEMKNPYIFNLIEYNNLLKLPEETQKMFLGSLLDIETRIANTENKEIKSDDLRVRLFKKENEKKRLYLEKENTEKEYMELSKKKDENTKNINKYVEILKRNSEMFRPINILNRIFSKQETEEQNKYYKSEAVKLEKENIKNTELIFEKMFYKNELNKQIQSIEKEVDKLREQYKLEDEAKEKETDMLKEKNMLFKVFGIDVENESIKENEIQIEQESEV